MCANTLKTTVWLSLSFKKTFLVTRNEYILVYEDTVLSSNHDNFMHIISYVQWITTIMSCLFGHRLEE